MKRVNEWDVIVIGGGIVGSSAAHFLAGQGMTCLLVERDGIASAQSGRNLGFVRQQGRDLRDLPLAIEANAIWSTAEADLGRYIGWSQKGNLSVADTAEKAADFEKWVSNTKSFGIGTELLTKAGTKARLPILGGEIHGGMFTASDGTADPVLATRAFFDNARQTGIDALIGTPVDEIVLSGGAVFGIRLGQSLLKARIVICAAGTATGHLLRKAGVSFPQDTMRGTMLRTERTNIALDIGVGGNNIAVRRSLDGSIHMSFIGGVYDVRIDSLRYSRWFLPVLKQRWNSVSINLGNLIGIAGDSNALQVTEIPPSRDNPKPSRKYADILLTRFQGMFPSLSHLKILSEWAGIIDYTPDLMPVVGTTRHVPGLLIGSGFSGHGFCLGPAAGKALADIAYGKPEPRSISGLSPDRFADDGGLSGFLKRRRTAPGTASDPNRR